MLQFIQWFRKTNTALLKFHLHKGKGPVWTLNNFSTFSSNSSEKNHYDILDVKRSATTGEIRDAFLSLSKECHPDVSSSDPGNHQKFVKINEAYSVLSKPLSRRDYDLTLQVSRHIRQQETQTAYRSYGYQADSPHYHYRNHVHWEGMGSPSGEYEGFQSSGKRMHRILVNYFSLTAFLTIGLVSVILMSKDFLVPDVSKKSGMKKQEIEMHDFIMASKQEGKTVFYYAVPHNQDPEKFEVLAVTKSSDEDSKDCVIEELNSASSASKL